MSKEFEDGIDVDDIVIKDIDVQDIEARKQVIVKDEDFFDNETGSSYEKSGQQMEDGEEQSREVEKQLEKAEKQLEEVEKQQEEAAEQPAELQRELAKASRQLEKSEEDSQPQEAAVSDLEDIWIDDPDPDDSVLSHDEGDHEENADDEVHEDKARPKRRKGKAGSFVIMFVALCVLVYSVFSLITIFMEYKIGEDQYDDLEKLASATAPPGEPGEPEYIDENDPLNPNFQIAAPDWNELREVNGDICAWIQFETLDQINYPVVHGEDDDYYLKHTVYRTSNSAGSIFIEAGNAADFSDMNTIIFGHNMKNGSMFGLLRYYKEADYYAGNEYFWIYTPEGNYRYKIFSCYEPMAVSETYTWWDGPCDEYTDYIKKIESYSKYSTGVTVNPTDKIVTLSTCTSRGSDYRFVVHGKLVYSSVNKKAEQPQADQQAPAAP